MTAAHAHAIERVEHLDRLVGALDRAIDVCWQVPYSVWGIRLIHWHAQLNGLRREIAAEMDAARADVRALDAVVDRERANVR